MSVSDWFVLIVWGGPTLVGVALFSWTQFCSMGPSMSSKQEMPESPGKAGEWNLWKERDFIEPLASQRLYFLLVFMGLIIAGATTTKVRFISLVLSGGGFLVVCSLSCTICRLFKKIDDIIDIKQKLQKDHEVVRHWTNHPPTYVQSNIILGQVIPFLCMLLLGVLFVYTLIYGVSAEPPR